jgi:steroid Delta-isomerase
MNAVETRALGSPLQQVVQFFTGLKPTSMPQMGQIYDAQAHFIDPFNDVHGLPAIVTIFEHMFTAMDAPRFEVISAFMDVDGTQAFLRWDFHFSKSGLGQNMRIHGSSYLRFNVAGKIVYHQDYWDSGKELFAKLPVIGAVIRWLSKQMQTPQVR